MNVKKFFVAIIFSALVSFNTCNAVELLAATDYDSQAWMLALVQEDDNYFVVAVNGSTNQGALVYYTREFYNFYNYQSPVIFTMAVHDSPRDVDSDLGEWKDDYHMIPVYALFNYNNGRVMLDSYPSSGAGLTPSHYQGRIQSPYHLKLVEVFLTRMPELHQAVESQNVRLP